MSTLLALDVAYAEAAGGDVGVAAAVAFDSWFAEASSAETVAWVRELRPYVPGRFFERELPCLLAVLRKLELSPDVVVVDGYAWLERDPVTGARRPGLGAELHRALGGQIPIVGVAKTVFRGASAHEVFRGRSDRPLWVTAVGMNPLVAAELVGGMHGAHRMPTLLKRVDALGREALRAGRGGAA